MDADAIATRLTALGAGCDYARALAEGPAPALVADLLERAEMFKRDAARAERRLDEATRGAHDALSRAGVPVCRTYGDGPWSDFDGAYTLEARVEMLAARSRTHDDRQMLPRSA